LLRRRARVVGDARISASFAHASKVWWTVPVNSTFRFLRNNRFNARHISISNERIPTCAHFPVIGSGTISSLGAIARVAKWLTFFLIVTSSQKVAFFIGSTI